MYEVGRPRRLTVEQAQEKERQWQDFGEHRHLAAAATGALKCCPARPPPAGRLLSAGFPAPCLVCPLPSANVPPTNRPRSALPSHPPAARFADARLQRSGRCHETEIIKALQRELPQFRREGALEGATLRQLVRNWAPDAERTSAGYFKGLSLLPAGGAPVPPPRAQPAGSSSAAGSSAAGSVDNSVDQY